MITIREFAVGTPEHATALVLREAILRTPIGLGWSKADHADEPICWHLGAFDGGTLVATLLLKPLGAGVLKMRQVAVDPARQGERIGTQLIAFAESFARDHGGRRLIAHARGTALGFYRKLGYVEDGEPFIEAAIPHQLVSKAL